MKIVAYKRAQNINKCEVGPYIFSLPSSLLRSCEQVTNIQILVYLL